MGGGYLRRLSTRTWGRDGGEQRQASEKKNVGGKRGKAGRVSIRITEKEETRGDAGKVYSERFVVLLRTIFFGRASHATNKTNSSTNMSTYSIADAVQDSSQCSLDHARKKKTKWETRAHLIEIWRKKTGKRIWYVCTPFPVFNRSG